MGAIKSTEKLSKSDPAFYSKIAKLAGEALLKKRGRQWFQQLAKLSHPRGEGNYHGGRPKKVKD